MANCIDCGKETKGFGMRCRSCALSERRNRGEQFGFKVGGHPGKEFKKGEHRGHEWKQGERIPNWNGFKPGHVMIQEVRDKISEGMLGKQNSLGNVVPQEVRDKISKTLKELCIGNRKGCTLTKVHKDKISKALSGANNPFYGKHLSEERKAKLRLYGEDSPSWKGGYEAACIRAEEKRRGFGYIPLNDRFIGSEGHHLDKEFVVYIPEEMHRSIWHSVVKDINMEEINALALDYVYGD